MRATVSIVGTRSPVSMNRIIGWERFVRAATWLSDSPARSRRRRMTTATASQTGSSEVRGRGCRLCAVIVYKLIGLIDQQRHEDFVEVFAVYAQRTLFDAFAHESNALIKTDGTFVVCTHVELDARDAGGLCLRNARGD